MKSIIIFGGTGFIGRHLIELMKDDYQISVFSRNAQKAKSKLSDKVSVYNYPSDANELAPYFDKANGVINLAGENIGGGRWTVDFKDRIMNSRLDVIKLIREAFFNATKKPDFFIQGSASGFYGINPSEAEITESRPSTRDSFLTTVAVKQEESASDLKDFTRLVFIRTGIVLDRKEGALPQIAMPFRMFAGGPIGNGKQWIPWIHINDEVKAIRHIIQNETLEGPVNLTAPHPVRQKEFAKQLGKVLHRPAFMPAPAFALKALLGKAKAEDLLLSGLKVIPEKLLSSGFSFQFKDLGSALNDVYSSAR